MSVVVSLNDIFNAFVNFERKFYVYNLVYSFFAFKNSSVNSST